MIGCGAYGLCSLCSSFSSVLLQPFFKMSSFFSSFASAAGECVKALAMFTPYQETIADLVSFYACMDLARIFFSESPSTLSAFVCPLELLPLE